MTGSHILDTMEQMQWIRRCTMRHIIPRNVSCNFADRMKNLLRKKNLVSLHWKVEIFDLNQKNWYLYDAGVNWTVRVSNLMLYVKFWWYSLYFSNLTSDLILYNVLYISIYKLTHNIKICCFLSILFLNVVIKRRQLVWQCLHRIPKYCLQSSIISAQWQTLLSYSKLLK